MKERVLIAGAGPVGLVAAAADPGLTRDYLLRVSMIASLKRAAELG